MSRSDEDSYAQNRSRAQELDDRNARIRTLNDRFRTTLVGGRIVVTAGVRALPLLTINNLVRQVAEFGPFTPDNDPYDQHDFGCIHIGDQRFFWKIDCYDKQLEFGSPDPGDEAVTARVLTIMLAEEY